MFTYQKLLSILGLTGDRGYISLNNQSNGQTGHLSRSWNRVIGNPNNIVVTQILILYNTSTIILFLILFILSYYCHITVIFINNNDIEINYINKRII